MTEERLKENLRHVGFTLPTPFTDDEAGVDRRAVREHVQSLVEADAQLFVPCGNTGEYYALDDDERLAMVSETTQCVDDQAVVGGAGGSINETLSLIDAYAGVGADGALVMTPPHTYMHEEGLLDYYTTLANESSLPLVLYKRGPELSLQTMRSLAEHDQIAGIKFAVNDIDGFSRAVHSMSDEVVWINGIAERFAPSFSLEGAEGFTTGIGNFLPEEVLALWKSLDRNDFEEAKRIRDRLRPLETLRAEPGDGNHFAAGNNVPTVKYCLDYIGGYGGPLREPLVELSEDDKKRAQTYLEDAQKLLQTQEV